MPDPVLQQPAKTAGKYSRFLREFREIVHFIDCLIVISGLLWALLIKPAWDFIERWLPQSSLFSGRTRLGIVTPEALLVGFIAWYAVFSSWWLFEKKERISFAKEGWRWRYSVLVFMVVSAAWITIHVAYFSYLDMAHPPNLRIHGSNTIGSELAPALAAAYLRSIGATDVHNEPDWHEDEVFVEGKTDSGLVRFSIHAPGTKFGLDDLARKDTDIAAASRRIKIDESGAVAWRDNENAEYVIGLDGIAIIVPVSRNIQSLTKEQVCKMFSGDEKFWPNGEPVMPYVRNRGSGTREAFTSMCSIHDDVDVSLLPRDSRYVFEDSQQLSDAVAKNKYAIGFVGAPFIAPAKAVAIAAGPDTHDAKIAALRPDEDSIRLEEYAFTRRLYFYTDPSVLGNFYTEKFIKFTLGPAGQAIVEHNGFVNQTIGEAAAQLPPDAPQDYAEITHNAKKLSLAVRFLPNSWVPDVKAQSDLANLKSFFDINPLRNGRVVVLGFADQIQGASPEANCEVAAERAQAVTQWLTCHQIPVTETASFGDKMLLTNDSSAEGLAKNRRVEIWVTQEFDPPHSPRTCPMILPPPNLQGCD